MYGKIQKLRFIAMGTSMLLAAFVFLLGSLWIKALYDGIDKAHLEDAGREIRSRLIMQRQVVLADMALFQLPQYVDILSPPSTRTQKPTSDLVPSNFDVTVYYNSSRVFQDGARKDAKTKALTRVTSEAMRQSFPDDSVMFDVAASEGQTSGLLLMDGKPWIVGLKVVKAKTVVSGYILAGRRLETRRLAATANISEQGFDVYTPDLKIGFPADVEFARSSMKGDSTSFTKLTRRGIGVGYLRFDDMFERTAFILKFSWVDAAVSGEKQALAWLFGCAMVFGGLIHAASSGALTWSVKQRRHTPGLAGLSDKEFKLTVESFPGYAFALSDQSTYLGMSRSLAGVVGKEPSDFTGKGFGSVAAEAGFAASEIHAKLTQSNQWPATEVITLSMQGLEGVYSFRGAVHFIAQKHIALYLVQLEQSAAQNSKPKTTDLAA